MSYTAHIRITRKGRTVHSESQTLDRKKLAVAWMNKREGDLFEPGGLERQALQDGVIFAKRPGMTSKRRQRDRRPTLEELDRLLALFRQRRIQAAQSIPMDEIVLCALLHAQTRRDLPHRLG